MILGTSRHFKELPVWVRQEVIKKLTQKDEVIFRYGNEKYYFHKSLLKEMKGQI